MLPKAGLGVGALAIAGIGVRARRQNVFFGDDQSPFEAWSDWEAGGAGGGLALVEAAVLAANPHNTQPWRFRISENAVEVHADLDRNLGSFDPFRRGLHLGLGCALENMACAAARFGMDARWPLPRRKPPLGRTRRSRGCRGKELGARSAHREPAHAPRALSTESYRLRFRAACARRLP